MKVNGESEANGRDEEVNEIQKTTRRIKKATLRDGFSIEKI